MEQKEMVLLKKDFQKVVKVFRNSLPKVTDWRGQSVTPEYPKAMMTNQQMNHSTATVNFGYANAEHQANMNQFIDSEIFHDFLKKHNASFSGWEINQDNRFQIRIVY